MDQLNMKGLKLVDMKGLKPPVRPEVKEQKKPIGIRIRSKILEIYSGVKVFVLDRLKKSKEPVVQLVYEELQDEIVKTPESIEKELKQDYFNIMNSIQYEFGSWLLECLITKSVVDEQGKVYKLLNNNTQKLGEIVFVLVESYCNQKEVDFEKFNTSFLSLISGKRTEKEFLFEILKRVGFIKNVPPQEIIQKYKRIFNIK